MGVVVVCVAKFKPVQRPPGSKFLIQTQRTIDSPRTNARRASGLTVLFEK